MANSEDVLERVSRLPAWSRANTPYDVNVICDALAAEVRELRKDRELLGWLLAQRYIVLHRDSITPTVIFERGDINAAMAAERGEGEA